ncbi:MULTISPECIES: PP2C family protein-serine/threonine phosphatase [Halomonas]|uniref:Fused response regulator/phosphatase n=1 Tax=Halomonas halophila TaxID=29573 RepID=A0ABQ0U0Y9_9GAMM|nr:MULTISPECIES: SpoIIE family protein phosphatase [Halomonas]MDR5888047.1 SpoIIE family protein phosphatase [Halomonas salina]RAH37471.1 serine/threonine protein phosphatase [Halomonas sp. SL1]WJY08572.1 SpoIIE family protein phosphatase [Halomonas halophila]GEK72203.1 fused response regulator/phosphatase [Halomonas halophila]
MPDANELVCLIDAPGAERDALAEVIAKEGLAVIAVECLEQLPDETVLAVAHARAVPSEAWQALAERLPTLVVSDDRQDSDLIHAVDAGLVDYVIEPRRHGHLLRRMIRRVIDLHRLAREREHDRERLSELNERLETHLAMLRLDQQAGGQIQRKLLPPRPQSIGGVRCDYWLVPSLYLSGDFLDFQRFDDRYTLFYFADVSGHGASSAFVTVLLKSLSHRWQQEWDGRHPEELAPRWLAGLNRELLDTGIGKHATLFVGVIDRERGYLHYSLGAQLPMPMLMAEGRAHYLEGEGMPVGLFPDVEYPRLGCALPADFRLWLCSDGILECLPGETLEARLEVLRARAEGSETILDLRRGLALGDDIAEADGEDDASGRDELPDDLTIMMLSGFGNDDA